VLADGNGMESFDGVNDAGGGGPVRISKGSAVSCHARPLSSYTSRIRTDRTQVSQPEDHSQTPGIGQTADFSGEAEVVQPCRVDRAPLGIPVVFGGS